MQGVRGIHKGIVHVPLPGQSCAGSCRASTQGAARPMAITNWQHATLDQQPRCSCAVEKRHVRQCEGEFTGKYTLMKDSLFQHH